MTAIRSGHVARMAINNTTPTPHSLHGTHKADDISDLGHETPQSESGPSRSETPLLNYVDVKKKESPRNLIQLQPR